MHSQRHDDPGTNLVEDDVRSVVSDNTEQPQSSWSQDFLRYWKLQFLAPIKSWRFPVERRKTAMYQNHWLATGHALLHLVPLSSAVAVLILNWSQYFVGPSFTLSTTLQFVAKLQELLMQASLAEIVLSIVRSQIMEGYLPLGALSASTQAMQISYLWSLDLLGAVTSRSFYGRRKALFVCLVPLLIILTALVGPSSAVLMIPRAGMSSAPYVVHWRSRSDEDAMFPSRLDNKQNLTFNLDRFSTTYAFTGESQAEYTSTQTYYNGNDTTVHLTSRALRYIMTEKEVSSGQGNFVVRSANATIPTLLSAQALYQIPMKKGGSTWIPGIDVKRSIKLPRVIVTAHCLNAYSTWQTTLDTPVAYSLDDGASIGTIPNLRNLIQHFLDYGGSRDTQVNAIPPLWVASPEPGSPSVVGSFIQNNCAGLGRYVISDLLLSKFNQSIPSSDLCLYIKTCTIAAFWEPSQHHLAADGGSWVVSTGSLSNMGHGLSKTTRPISADLDSITSLNTPLFSAKMFEDVQSDSTRLAVALATVFSEIPWKEQVQSALGGEQYTVIEIALTRLGYGYETSSISTRLSLIVVMAYCIFAVGYITYMLSSGHTSTAWNSATEIIVLALESKCSEHLYYVSAGINSIKTYQEPVGIRVNDRNQLELVFEHDQSNQLRKFFNPWLALWALGERIQ